METNIQRRNTIQRGENLTMTTSLICVTGSRCYKIPKDTYATGMKTSRMRKLSCRSEHYKKDVNFGIEEDLDKGKESIARGGVAGSYGEFFQLLITIMIIFKGYLIYINIPGDFIFK